MMLAGLMKNEAKELLSGPLPQATGLCALVAGMGLSGQSASRLILHEGGQVIAYESDAAKAEALRREWTPRGVKVLTGELKCVDGIDYCVLSPGFPPNAPLIEMLRRAGVYITGEVEFGCRFLQRPLIAITGTDGKTTVTHLTAHVLKYCGFDALMGGNVGLPVCDAAVSQPRISRRPMVIEVSSYQCETFEEFHARVGVITNLAPDHLSRYDSVETYYKTKFNIVKNQTPMEALWMGPGVEGYCPEWVSSRKRTFAIDAAGPDGLYFLDGTLRLRDGATEECAPAPELNSWTSVMRLNALASMGAAVSYGAPLRKAVEALASFSPLPHRQQFAGVVKGVRCYNDSKATSVHAVQAALEALPGPIRLIAGGQAKGDDLASLNDLLKTKARCAYLIGRDAALLEDAWSAAVEIKRCQTLEDAVKQALDDAEAGETLLLSPACASWDMFSSYEERGERFMKAVKEYR
ncbi:MAG: UDP-N-acetylmuramoyl-L-alanine--D-glutamate ligase [bacterium]|nr:UDP-N-acetylmuramoyl-L-alanine--D-glutamate ligase [bacterium]